MADQTNLHGTCVAIGAHGVVLLGPSGSGKSDLALRLLDAPGRGASAELLETRLVADDQVLINRVDGHLVARAPVSLRGRLEVRGLGIISTSLLCDEIQLSLALRLVHPDKIERLPNLGDHHVEILGLSLPALEIAPFQASAPALVRTVVSDLGLLFSNEDEVSACEPGSFTA